MRVSTNEIFRTGLEAMQKGQSELARTQLQMSSGKRILNAADDPRGAVQALQLRERIAAVDQYERNASFATGRLTQEETVLQQMGTALQRVRELAVQGGNATLSNEARGALAVELRQILDALVDSANTRDANGEYLFAGFQSATRPFVVDAAGEIEYLGDNGQRHIALSPERQIAIGDSGELFMTIPRGNGVFAVTPGAANTGAAWVAATEVVDPTAVTNDTYTIRMTSPSAYEVLDVSSTVIATGTYVDGQAIDIGGRRIVLHGAPATGDIFDVGPAGSDSIFAIVGDLAAALETARYDDASRAELNGSIGFALQSLDQALGREIDLRAEIGARLNTIESQDTISEERKLLLQSTLSRVEDLDYAEAISRLSVQQAALQAAQKTYVEVGRLSLFDFIR